MLRLGKRVVGAVVAGGATSIMLADAQSSTSSVPPFQLDKTRFDESTYWGRVQNMIDVIDPRLLLTTDEQLEKAQRLLKEFEIKKSKPENTTDAQLWEAKKIVTGIIHPVTGEKMFWAGRMNAFVPVNLPVLVGMLIHGPRSTGATVFWQIMNQTVNAACNYANRSGAEVDVAKLGQSFGLAVATSCTIAIASSRAVKKYPSLQRFSLFIPYIAVISASTANLMFSRMEEWRKGVPVFDKSGNQVGLSAKAGFKGVSQTIVTRAWLVPVPVLFLPPILMDIARKRIQSRGVLLATEVGIIMVALQFALPLTLAIQPQRMTLDVRDLEPELQNLKDSEGNPITQVFANKGL